MKDSVNIPVLEAAQWLARMASVDGAITANGMALLKEFADTFGLDIATAERLVTENNPAPAELPLPEIDEEAVYVPKRIVRPMSELKKSQAAQPKMSIRMPDGTLIRREKMTDTFRDFIMGMGWEDVRYLNFDVYGQDLITQEHPTGWYKELVPGWYVNTGMKANTMRTTAYEIARALGKKIVVSWD